MLGAIWCRRWLSREMGVGVTSVVVDIGAACGAAVESSRMDAYAARAVATLGAAGLPWVFGRVCDRSFTPDADRTPGR